MTTAPDDSISQSPAILPPAPARACEDGTTLYGRYQGAIRTPDLELRLSKRIRLKEWHYTSLTTDRHFVSLAVAQLRYAGHVFAYFVDRERPEQMQRFDAVLPLGLGVRFAPSSVEGATRFRRGRTRIELEYDDGWSARLFVPLGEAILRGRIHFQADETLALLHQLPGDRPAYTHKGAGLRATGLLHLGGQRINADGGLVVLDWTRTLATRRTRWKWASFAWRRDDGATFGLNLSSDVYDDASGASRENVLWINGRMHLLGGVRFDLPRNPGCEDWTIRSVHGDEVDLRFEPQGAHHQELDFGLVRDDFVQPYGIFRGRVAGKSIDGAFGVVEDHDAIW